MYLGQTAYGLVHKDTESICITKSSINLHRFHLLVLLQLILPIIPKQHWQHCFSNNDDDHDDNNDNGKTRYSILKVFTKDSGLLT